MALEDTPPAYNSSVCKSIRGDNVVRELSTPTSNGTNVRASIQIAALLVYCANADSFAIFWTYFSIAAVQMTLILDLIEADDVEGKQAMNLLRRMMGHSDNLNI